MLEPALPKARFEHLGPIPAAEITEGRTSQMLDTIDIWLAAGLQSLFNLIRR